MKYIEFEDHVRRAVRASSRPQKEIAAGAGLDRAKMDNFMRGRFLPQRTLERLAAELGMSFTWRGRLAAKVVEAPKAKGAKGED